jgi:hypothetical protein
MTDSWRLGLLLIAFIENVDVVNAQRITWKDILRRGWVIVLPTTKMHEWFIYGSAIRVIGRMKS